ncbi:hypothetical protein GSI_12134 [Ganoderma sinense ZZ0214-1]|uniref:Uncharacterized protein n=1 Tax=Ganoderma sinense ZZ0214-1 TaxID=1077348 RepID=A0A2G8RYI3_9APHY|nr:hypothetical protein GSI_12134 [Ganoderma sinense ZZ0214-1]
MTIIAIPPLAQALPEMRDGLNLLVVGTVFASFLIPVAVLLFFFTPVTIWRSPLFVLNVLAIILGLALQIIYIYVIINTTLIRAVPTGMVIMIVAMNFLVPICVQGILLVRLVGVYPPTANSRKQNLLIYIPVTVFKIARLVNAALATRDLINHEPDSLGVIVAAQIVWGTKYVKVEWFLQLFDDMFVSGLFVYKLYVSVMTRKEAGIDTGHSESGANYSWAQRIRTLYYIAVSNFVFPILFNIAEIAIIFYDSNFFHGAMVVTVNCYVTIIGVILATIWAQGSKRGKPHAGAARGGSRGHRTTTVLGSLQFASRHVESQMPDGDDDDEEFEDGPPRGKQARGQAMREVPSGESTPKEKSVFFQSVGGSTVITRGTVDEEAEPEEKRVCESSSCNGSITAPEPSPEPEPELHNTAAGEDEPEKRAESALGSLTSLHGRESPRCCMDVEDDPISFAV